MEAIEVSRGSPQRDQTEVVSEISTSPTLYADYSPLGIERQNLLHVVKLVIKGLIDAAVNQSRTIREDHPLLQRFFTVLDHIVCHGLRPSRRGVVPIFGLGTPDPWPVVELVERVCPDAAGITSTVRDMSELKTGLGRLRAWLRLAHMQKRLGDYFRILIENRHRLRLGDYYHPAALLLQEEGTVMAGLLLGLNVIDCNFVIKDQVRVYDSSMGVVNYSAYMRKAYEDDANDFTTSNSSNEIDAEMESLLDQKNYLEELNEHLKSSVEKLQSKLRSAEEAAQNAKNEVAQLKNALLTLQEDCAVSKAEKDSIISEFERHKRATDADLQVERETFQTSRIGLDGMNAELQKRLRDEANLRMEAEKALRKEQEKKGDSDLSIGLLEKQLREKQEVIVNLRRQVDEIKAINLDLSGKMKGTQESFDHKAMLVSRLEEKCAGIQEIMDQMERRLQSSQADKQAAEETARRIGQQLAVFDTKCSERETDLRIQTELRLTLQQQLEKQNAEMNRLRAVMVKNQELVQERDRLVSEVSRLNQLASEQENALSEMAGHLSLSKLETDNLKEETAALREAQWTDDKAATDCKQCTKTFNVSRRRHHCRHCGGIFCNECSNNKMPLASSARPVRVCDACHMVLLQRCQQRP